jgi:hypothetical protein
VHKLVFCSLSKFFDKACNNFKEAETGIVVLKHGDVEVLHRMMAWFKTGEYCEASSCLGGNQKVADEQSDEQTLWPSAQQREGI